MFKTIAFAASTLASVQAVTDDVLADFCGTVDIDDTWKTYSFNDLMGDDRTEFTIDTTDFNGDPMTLTWKYCGDELSIAPNGYVSLRDANGDDAFEGVAFDKINATSNEKDVSPN